MVERVLVEHLGKKTWLDVSKVIAMCEEDHSIFFECVVWYLSDADWAAVFKVWNPSAKKKPRTRKKKKEEEAEFKLNPQCEDCSHRNIMFCRNCTVYDTCGNNYINYLELIKE